MNNQLTEVIIDTDFFNKITLAPNVDDGKDLFIRTMNELNVQPVVHYYVAKREMPVKNPIATELVDSGYLKVYQKKDIVKNQEEEQLYENYFRKWYNYLNFDKPRLEKNVDVFELLRAEHSLGEIHSTLMAYFLNLKMIMSDDSDAADLVKYAGLSDIEVWNLVDVYSTIGGKAFKTITIQEVENVIRSENSRDSIKEKQRKKQKFKKVKSVWLPT